ncbi:hypothetical protein [Priestia aryabhattai]|uniref:hypothetical protein n=1 Tax=Priestia aryabhattai TaxID=412384 RepID=UPI001ADABB4B|nr:hypothetical protein [Priestia aryabhattai]QTL49960.1 hypothetical protein J5Z55_02260 [Priestia aryabhattai]
MDFQSIATTVVTSGIVSSLFTLGIQTYLKQGITHHFNKELALFNAEIAVQAESRKLDFDRKMHDFSIYSTKRHEFYPELFKKLHKVIADFKGVEDIVLISTEFIALEDKNTFTNYLNDLGVIFNERLKNQIDELFKEYERDSDLDKHLLKARHVIEHHLLTEIGKKYDALHEFYIGNLLYFSDDVSKESNILIQGLGYLLAPITIPPHLKEKFNKELLCQEIESGLFKLKEIIKNELSVGDYS